MNLKFKFSLFIIEFLLLKVFAYENYEQSQNKQNQLEDDADDILEFQSCSQTACSKDFESVQNNFMIAAEYAGILDCMKYKEECLKVENPKTMEEYNKLKQIHRCFEFCFNFKKFSKEIENLNKCNIQCVESTIQNINQRNLQNSHLSDPFNVKGIFFSTLIAVSIIFGIYYVCQRRRNQKINQLQNSESHLIDQRLTKKNAVSV
ncbi:hypothetical protein ABPG72_003770 [Tetrahymena utriculariae]